MFLKFDTRYYDTIDDRIIRCFNNKMSIEHGTYTQGEHKPRNPEVRTPLGSTALVFLRPDLAVEATEPVIFVIDDPELLAFDTIEEKDDIQPSYAKSSEDYRLLMRKKQSHRNRRIKNRKRR